MPKEQRHFGDWVVRSTSKNAKHKHNSATLWASQGGTHGALSGMGNISRRMTRCDSEKDSGYSEAGSDSLQTDVDDQRSSVSEPHWESSLNATGHSMSPYEELTPIYVINNLVVKPSRRDQFLQGPLAWGGGWNSFTGAKAPTQLLLIQQPAIPAPSSSTPNPSPSLAKPRGQINKGGSCSNKMHSSKNSYLPILNSYPRIAPHPRKDSHEEGKGATGVGGVKESGSEGHSKRVCTEEKQGAVSTTSHLQKPQQQHHQTEGKVHSHSHSQHKVRGSFPNPPHRPQPGHASSSTTHPKSHRCHQSPCSDSEGSPSVSSSQTPCPPFSSESSTSCSVAHSPYCPAPEAAGGSSLSDSQSECSSIRQRRFHNTAEILNQTGLMAITLRAKELLEQNAATERELAQLRQHAHLLCQVAQAGQQGSNSLDTLLQAMTETASYPNLDLNQLQSLSSNPQQSKMRDEYNKERAGSGRNNKKQKEQSILMAYQTCSLPPIQFSVPDLLLNRDVDKQACIRT
ncbi:CLOCK-interacting pacemaker [Diretmus argenteus]